MFLRPDPQTCAAVTTVTGLLRAQYGFVSAGAFPPHATMAGSLPLAADRGEEDLLAAVGGVVRDRAAVAIQNSGPTRLGGSLVYDLSRADGRTNEALVDLAEDLTVAVVPLLGPTAPGELAADVHDRAGIHGHLSLASHDLEARPDLYAEVDAYVRGLAVPVPGRFSGEVVTVVRQRHPTWSGAWWRDFTWEHVRSWTLGSAAP